MKLLAFLGVSSFFATPIQFIDFWRESDVFAMRIQREFPSESAKNTFWSYYSDVRKSMEFYQDSGACDYFFQNPTFELVDVKAFNDDLSVAKNTEKLIKNIDDWLNSAFRNFTKFIQTR